MKLILIQTENRENWLPQLPDFISMGQLDAQWVWF